MWSVIETRFAGRGMHVELTADFQAAFDDSLFDRSKFLI